MLAWHLVPILAVLLLTLSGSSQGFMPVLTPIPTPILDALEERANQREEAENQAFLKSARSSLLNVSLPANPFSILWYAPFYSGGGYCNEAIDLAIAFKDVPNLELRISQHGDTLHESYQKSMDPNTLATLQALEMANVDMSHSVSVCHSQPSAWQRSSDMYPGQPEGWCPPFDAKLRIGRTMFETDRIPEGWADHMDDMDAIFVPTHFNKQTFSAHGVDERKIYVIPEPSDCSAFGLNLVKPLSQLRTSNPLDALSLLADTDGYFTFLSVFKWESRKGAQFLFRAFLSEFTKADKVALVVLTHGPDAPKPTNSTAPLVTNHEYITAFAAQDLQFTAEQIELLPPVLFLPFVSDADIVQLYGHSNALVQPTRGEGWGLPEAEAMCMQMPVIATNWSGITEFLTENNGYPLRVESIDMDNEDGPGSIFYENKWATPSVSHLRELMRHVMTHPAETESKGRQGRHDMIHKYCTDCVAKQMLDTMSMLLTKKHS